MSLLLELSQLPVSWFDAVQLYKVAGTVSRFSPPSCLSSLPPSVVRFIHGSSTQQFTGRAAVHVSKRRLEIYTVSH